MVNDDNIIVIDSKPHLGMKLTKATGVEFMVSCLTGTTSNPKRAIGENDENVRERRTAEPETNYVQSKIKNKQRDA